LTIKRFTNPGATKDCASHREPMSAASNDDAQQQSMSDAGQRMPAVGDRKA
jgi:hypothetical protein